MSRLLFTIPFIFNLACFAQINPQKLDSLTHAIDSTQKRVQAWQDSFTKKQDSLYQSGMRKAARRGNLEQEPQYKRKLSVISGILIALCTLVAVLFVLKKKRKDGHPERGSDGFNT